jgi:hypothetical protein
VHLRGAVQCDKPQMKMIREGHGKSVCLGKDDRGSDV